LEALDHPNIIKFIEAYIENGTLNIVMDYADGGDLSAKIKNAKGCYFS
jgi:NIMA (never in mitosis gene a)-related kinase